MTEEQKALLQTFPKSDRGLFGEEGSDNEDGQQKEVEEDFIEAATKKAKIKQKNMRQRKQEREGADEEGADEELGKKRVRFVNDEEEVLNSEDEF